MRVSLRAAGPFACFTNPQLKPERWSYPWITPSAARGLLRAVYAKPEFRYDVREIRVLKPIRFASIRCNEVQGLKLKGDGFKVDEDRTQVFTLLLRDVAYEISADIVAFDGLPEKHVGIFTRRLENQQSFVTPSLGLQQYFADLQPARGEPPLPIDYDAGPMFYGFSRVDRGRKARGDYGEKLFFHGRLEQGVCRVPPRVAILEQQGVHDAAWQSG